MGLHIFVGEKEGRAIGLNVQRTEKNTTENLCDDLWLTDFFEDEGQEAGRADDNTYPFPSMIG